MDSAARWRDGGRSRVRLFLVSSSVAALLVGGGARSAFAQCAVSPATDQSQISNSVAINCINVQGVNVTGNVVNTGSGTIIATAATAPSRTGITVNAGTVGGTISNAGTITASHNGAAAVLVTNNAAVLGGLTNTGSISGKVEGIFLNGISTFAGGINNQGAISAGGSAAIRFVNVSSFTGGITNSGVITSTTSRAIGIDTGAPVGTFSGGISNSGTISGQADGVFVRVETFTGGLSNSGFVFAGFGRGLFVNSISSFSGDLSNSGTVTAAAGTALEVFYITRFSGNVVNSGTINAHNTGILVVGTASFIGDVVNSGTIHAQTGIAINSVSSFTGTVSNSGTISAVTGIVSAFNASPVNVFDSGTINATGGTAVDMSADPAGGSFTLGPGYNINGLVIGQSGDTFQLGGTGAGSFDLSLISTQYLGFDSFNVVSGVWTTTGTFSGAQTWNVKGGTLAGTGTFAGINVNSGGTLEPGLIGQPGTFMTVNSNLTFQNGAIYAVNIGPTTASRVNVAGAVSLAGAVQGILTPGSYSTKTSYDILDPPPAHSITGTFTGFSSPNAPGFGGILTYTPSDVLLNLTAQIGAGGGLNANQQSVANVINSFFNNGGTLPAGFFPAFGLNGGSVLSQLSGEAATGSQQGAKELMTQFLTLMLDPNVDGRGGGTAMPLAPEHLAEFPPDVALAYASVFKAPVTKAPTFEQRWSAWGASFGGYNKTDGDPGVGSNTVTARDFGFAAGMDYRLTRDTIVGFALAGGGTNWGLAAGLGGGRSDAFQAGLYAKSTFGPAYLAGSLAFANHWITTNRSALAEQLTASFNGQSFGARAEAGYRLMPVATIGVTPYGALQVQTFHTPSYSETDLTGGGLGLNFNAMTATDTRSELGARFDDPTLVYGMPLILRGRLAWAHDWVSNPSLGAVFQTLPRGAFTVNGAASPHNSALASAGAQLFLRSDWSLSGRFDGEFASGSQTYAGTATLRHTW